MTNAKRNRRNRRWAGSVAAWAMAGAAWGQKPAAPIHLPAAPSDVTLTFDHADAAGETGQAVFSGHVTAVIQSPAQGAKPARTVTVHADALTVYPALTTFSAHGNVTVVSDGREVYGDRADFDWTEQTGQAETVSTTQYGIAFQAHSLEYRADSQVLHDAVFSTCRLEDPEYVVLARTVEIVPNKRIVARHIRLRLFGVRLPTLPRLEYGLEQGQARQRHALPVPRPGYSHVSGFSLRIPIPLTETVEATAEPTTHLGFRGRVVYEGEGSPAPYARLYYREEQGVRSRLPVLVSRIPQAGLRFGPHNAGNVDAGYFKEYGNVSAGRVNAEWNQTLLDRGEKLGLTLRGGARVSSYTTGNTYSTVRGEAEIGHGGRDIFERVGIRLNAINGHTPFQWDQVQIQTELFAGQRIRLGMYHLEADVRYDLSRREVYDTEVALARRFRCIEPEIRYSTRRRAVTFNVQVVGFGEARPPAPGTDEGGNGDPVE